MLAAGPWPRLGLCPWWIFMPCFRSFCRCVSRASPQASLGSRVAAASQSRAERRGQAVPSPAQQLVPLCSECLLIRCLFPDLLHLRECLFFFFFFFLLIYLFWLCWVFASAQGPSPVAASGGHSSSRPLLLRSTGSRRAGPAVVAHRPSRSAARGTLPDQGANPRPLH